MKKKKKKKLGKKMDIKKCNIWIGPSIKINTKSFVEICSLVCVWSWNLILHDNVISLILFSGHLRN